VETAANKPENVSKSAKLPEHAVNAPSRLSQPKSPITRAILHSKGISISGVNVYIPHGLPRLTRTQKCIFGHVEAEDEVARATRVEKAEVQGAKQVQGAMGSSGGNKMEDGNSDDITNNASGSTKHTT
jgi:hypothetical protein